MQVVWAKTLIRLRLHKNVISKVNPRWLPAVVVGWVVQAKSQEMIMQNNM